MHHQSIEMQSKVLVLLVYPCELSSNFVHLAYYKAVADMTKDDKEDHKAHDVFVEKVRLTDEHAIEQHTDESGDLFMWLKYQARQGVFNAQVIYTVFLLLIASSNLYFVL